MIKGVYMVITGDQLVAIIPTLFVVIAGAIALGVFKQKLTRQATDITDNKLMVRDSLQEIRTQMDTDNGRQDVAISDLSARRNTESHEIDKKFVDMRESVSKLVQTQIQESERLKYTQEQTHELRREFSEIKRNVAAMREEQVSHTQALAQLVQGRENQDRVNDRILNLLEARS